MVFTSGRTSKRVRLGLAAGLAWGGMGLAACWPGDVTSLQELDVVVTVHDSTANFRNQTYVMPDTIVESRLGIDSNITLTRDFDSLILATVAAQMANKGYQRVSESDFLNSGADYAVLVEASASTVTTYYASYPWCGGWGWWGGWGWYGGCYPGYYPPVVGSTSYDQGTVFVNMIDQCNPAATRCTRIWIGALNGVLASSPTGNRLVDGIARMYEQSPYLGPNATTTTPE